MDRLTLLWSCSGITRIFQKRMLLCAVMFPMVWLTGRRLWRWACSRHTISGSVRLLFAFRTWVFFKIPVAAGATQSTTRLFIHINTKRKWDLFWANTRPPSKFYADLCSSFFIILPTNKQMDTDENLTSVAEVIKALNCRKSQIELKLENKVAPKVCSFLFLLQRSSHSALLGWRVAINKLHQ